MLPSLRYKERSEFPAAVLFFSWIWSVGIIKFPAKPTTTQPNFHQTDIKLQSFCYRKLIRHQADIKLQSFCCQKLMRLQIDIKDDIS